MLRIQKIEKNLNDGINKKIIVSATHKYKLNRHFKELTSYLKTKHVHLSRTDRIIIALVGQTKSDVESKDTKINQTISLLKVSQSPWQRDFLQLEQTK